MPWAPYCHEMSLGPHMCQVLNLGRRLLLNCRYDYALVIWYSGKDSCYPCVPTYRSMLQRRHTVTPTPKGLKCTGYRWQCVNSILNHIVYCSILSCHSLFHFSFLPCKVDSLAHSMKTLTYHQFIESLVYTCTQTYCWHRKYIMTSRHNMEMQCFPLYWPFVRAQGARNGVFDFFIDIRLNKLLNTVEVSVLWDAMTLIWHHCDINP